MEEDDQCIKHFFCNCFQLVETERNWEFGLVVCAIVIITITWFFALIMVPKTSSSGSGATLAVWMAWLLGFTLVTLLALLMVRRGIEHKIKYKRFRDSTRDPWLKALA